MALSIIGSPGFALIKEDLYSVTTGFQSFSKWSFVVPYTVLTADPEEPAFNIGAKEILQFVKALFQLVFDKVAKRLLAPSLTHQYLTMSATSRLNEQSK